MTPRRPRRQAVHSRPGSRSMRRTRPLADPRPPGPSAASRPARHQTRRCARSTARRMRSRSPTRRPPARRYPRRERPADARRLLGAHPARLRRPAPQPPRSRAASARREARRTRQRARTTSTAAPTVARGSAAPLPHAHQTLELLEPLGTDPGDSAKVFDACEGAVGLAVRDDLRRGRRPDPRQGVQHCGVG